MRGCRSYSLRHCYLSDALGIFFVNRPIAKEPWHGPSNDAASLYDGWKERPTDKKRAIVENIVQGITVDSMKKEITVISFSSPLC
jgi:hypothetical protein